MSRASVFGAIVVLVLTACASRRTQLNGTQVKAEMASVDVTHDPRFKCVMERTTGSNIAEKVCRYDDPDSDEHRRRTQDLLRRAESQNTQTVPSN
jgi:hypothetical protein